MLEVSIKKRLGTFNLDVCFRAENEVMALLGGSGCGKSMTLKCIAGIERPDSGFIVLDGRTLFDSKTKVNLSPQDRHMGYLFQQYALFPNMTVRQNIASGFRGRDKGGRSAAVADKIAMMRLEGLEDKLPAHLSGGQQQRTALARILTSEPRLLLLDEPFSSLDSYLKWQLELDLADALSLYPGTAIYVSHDRDEVYRLCDSVCVLNAGKSENKLPTRRLFELPETLSAALLSGCKNFTRIRRIDNTRFDALDWGVTLSAESIPPDADFAGVRAHYIRPAAEDAENSFLCEVDRVVDNLFSTIIMLKTPGGGGGNSRLRVELPPEEWKDTGANEKLRVRIEPGKILFLRGEV